MIKYLFRQSLNITRSLKMFLKSYWLNLLVGCPWKVTKMESTIGHKIDYKGVRPAAHTLRAFVVVFRGVVWSCTLVFHLLSTSQRLWVRIPLKAPEFSQVSIRDHFLNCSDKCEKMTSPFHNILTCDPDPFLASPICIFKFSQSKQL